MKYFTVESVAARDAERRLTLTDANGRTSSLRTPRFSIVGKGDTLCIDPVHPRNVFITCKETAGLIRVLPHYENECEARIGDLVIPLKVHEPITSEEISSFQGLEQFHYKTFSSDDNEVKTQSVGGRKAVLLVSARISDVYVAVGYIELHMPLLMVKPRHDLFDAGFHHPTRPIAWETWDQHAIRKYVNTIVRIARVVIHPEFRGLGLAKVCLDAAKTFARERWHIGGVRPLFMEISAEMLNHIDFVSRSGFHFVGKTEGNLARVGKDLVHMGKGYDVSSGIMSLQKRYLSAVQVYCRSAGQTIDEVLARLRVISGHADPLEAMTPMEWVGLRPALRFPIPYYLCGLDDSATIFLDECTRGKPKEATPRRLKPTEHSIELSEVTVKSDYLIPQTRNVRLILNCFGIQSTALKTTLVGPLSIKASSGNVIFVSGSSGAGKSLLLRALDPATRDADPHLAFQVAGDKDYAASWIRPLPEDTPIFEFFAERYSAAKALRGCFETAVT